MRKHEIFPSKYLKPEDLNGRPLTVTIIRAPLELLKSPDGKEQNKIVLYLQELQKAFPLNVTNFDACADICGEDTDDWPGHAIVLYPTKTSMAGKMWPCIRIRRPDDRRRPEQPWPAPTELPDEQSLAEVFDDEIGF